MKKKILILMSAIALPVLTVVSCGNNGENNAQKPESPQKPPQNPKHKFSKLLVLGDSLSDQGALTGFANDFLGNLIEKLDKSKTISAFIPKKFSLKNPYFDNKSFTNDKVAVELLAEKMGLESAPAWDFQNLKLSLPFLGPISPTIELDPLTQRGTNFSIASSTIYSKFDTYRMLKKNYNLSDEIWSKIINWLKDYTKSLALQKFTLENQTKALLNQYKKIDGSQLIYINIANNDLMNMVEDDIIGNEHLVAQRIEQMIARLKYSLNLLVNNGAQNMIVANAIELSKVPLIQKKYPLSTPFLNNAVKSYNQQVDNLIKYFNQKTNVSIKKHDVYKDFLLLLEKFLGISAKNKLTNATSYDINYDVSELSVLPTYEDGVKQEDLSNYFFIDQIHPTAWAHKQIAEKIYEIVLEF